MSGGGKCSATQGPASSAAAVAETRRYCVD